ncbi:MAG TPA: hypothetical protein VMS17_17420 [Gemmataceae bacterium]|nr:hypothetical protein [Gemmataceae bacterium]
MNGNGSIFLDFQLPTAATWFYFSGLLAVALFVKFSRLLSVRNLDVLSLFLFAPGFLLLLESHGANRWGYAWLLIASGYFFLRCLGDLALVRRPALAPNMNLSGMACLAAALSASLVAVAVQQPRAPPDAGQAAASPIDEMLVKTLPQTPGEVAGFTIPIGTARALALLCHLSVAVGLALIGWKHFGDVHAGMAMATFYLLLPYTYMLTPNSALGLGRWDMVWPMAWMVWAVFCYRRPVLAGAFLGVAAGGVLLPLLTLPVWLSFYRKRGAGRFFLCFVLLGGLTLALAAGVLWIGSLTQTWNSADALQRWQAWLPPPDDAHGVWQGVYWVYRLPVFIAYAAFVIGTLFWPMPKNLANVVALSAAVLIGIQFWCADNGGVYVLWYLPFLLLLVFRPNLTAAQPPPPREDWIKRISWRLMRLFVRLFRRRKAARSASGAA